eukprot:s451_g3.t2
MRVPKAASHRFNTAFTGLRHSFCDPSARCPVLIKTPLFVLSVLAICVLQYPSQGSIGRSSAFDVEAEYGGEFHWTGRSQRPPRAGNPAGGFQQQLPDDLGHRAGHRRQCSSAAGSTGLTSTALHMWCLSKLSRRTRGDPPEKVADAPLDVWIPGTMPDAPAEPRQVLRSSFAHEQSGGGTTDDSADLDPILALDDFTVALPDGFPDHAHRGFITMTYLLPSSPGALSHEDFLGNAGILQPGDAQWMTCGRGILHSEVPDSHFFARGLQMYLEQSRGTQLRVAAQAGGGNITAAVLAGEALGHGPVEGPRHGPELAPEHSASPRSLRRSFLLFLFLYLSALSVSYWYCCWPRVHFTMEPLALLHQSIPEGHSAFIYILLGQVLVAGVTADANHCLVLTAAPGEDGVTVRTESSEASFFLCDKTFFIAALLAMRHDRLAVFFGSAGALAAMTALSATIGLVLPKLMPRKYTHWAAVALFVYFGLKLLWEALQMLRSGSGSGPSEELEEVEQSLKEESPKAKQTWAVAGQALTLTFLAEWGDRSQISTIALAAAKDPLGPRGPGGSCPGRAHLRADGRHRRRGPFPLLCPAWGDCRLGLILPPRHQHCKEGGRMTRAVSP